MTGRLLPDLLDGLLPLLCPDDLPLPEPSLLTTALLVGVCIMSSSSSLSCRSDAEADCLVFASSSLPFLLAGTLLPVVAFPLFLMEAPTAGVSGLHGSVSGVLGTGALRSVSLAEDDDRPAAAAAAAALLLLLAAEAATTEAAEEVKKDDCALPLSPDGFGLGLDLGFGFAAAAPKKLEILF